MLHMVSIVIPVKDNFKLTRACLESIFRNTEGVEYEVVVVDNGSTDETPQFFSSLKDPRVVYIRLEENLGFSKGCNIGAKASKGKFLIFLNNDTEVKKGWIEPIVKELERDRKTITGSRLLYPDGTIQHAGVVVDDTLGFQHLYRRFPSDFHGVLKRREFIGVTGACLGINRDRFFELGMFFEGYINGLEDIDLCFENRKRGGKNLYVPESTVVHYESKTAGRKDNESHNTKILRDRIGMQKSDISKYMIEDGCAARYFADQEGNTYLLAYPFYTYSKEILKGFRALKELNIPELKRVLKELKRCPRPEAILLRSSLQLLSGNGFSKTKLFRFLMAEIPELLGSERTVKEVLIHQGKLVTPKEVIDMVERASSVNEALFYLEKIKLNRSLYLEKSRRILGNSPEFQVRKEYHEALMLFLRILSKRLSLRAS